MSEERRVNWCRNCLQMFIPEKHENLCVMCRSDREEIKEEESNGNQPK